MKKLFTLCCLLAANIIYAQTGNVGIGTTTPQAQLHTTRSVRFDTLKGTGNRLVYATENGNLYTPPAPQNINTSSIGIPDGNCTGITSPVTISNMPTTVPSGNIRVRINVAHTWVSDLLIYLVSPSGQVLNLTYSNGSNGDNYTNTIFWDGASQFLPIGSRVGTPFTGIYKPTGSTAYDLCAGTAGTVTTFGALGGGAVVPNGTWTLKVIDFSSGDVGTLNNWSITFDNADPPTASGNPFSTDYILKGTSTGTISNSSIYDNGNVGIGTSTPTQKLDVAGTVNATSFTGNGNTLNNVVNTSTDQTIVGVKTFSSNIIANGNIGIGTLTPTQKLDVAGVIKATGITTSPIGTANMVAVAYGVVYSNATNTIATSSGNCTLTNRSNPNTVGTGVYEINFSGSNLIDQNFGNLPVVLSLYGSSPGFINFSGTTGKITVYTFNSNGAAADRGFSFAVYKP